MIPKKDRTLESSASLRSTAVNPFQARELEDRALDGLIEDTLNYPLSAEAFTKFLEEKYLSEENFEFLRAAHQVESKWKEDPQVKEDLTQLEDKFVRSDAEKPVNLSSAVREGLLQGIKTYEPNPEEKDVTVMMAPSKKEIRIAFQQAHFVEKYLKEAATNIPPEESNFRIQLGSVFFLLAIGLFFALPYELRALEFLLLLPGFALVVSGYTRV